MRAVAAASLCRCAGKSRAGAPMRAKSGRLTRVSSQAIQSTDASTPAARALRSARWPMGVATTYNEPD